MNNLLKKISNIEFQTGVNFSYNLDKEYDLISSCLNNNDKDKLAKDFERFFEKGRFVILNTISGGILFLKEPEEIENITIKSHSNTREIELTVIYKSKYRNSANIKYKPNAGKIESMQWNSELIFPNFFEYSNKIQSALLLIIGKVVKRICEYGRINFAYMKIMNEFEITTYLNEEIRSRLKVQII